MFANSMFLIFSFFAMTSVYAQTTTNIFKKISTDDDSYLCGITTTQLICWGAPSAVEYLQLDPLPQIKAPLFLDTATDVVCTASTDKVACAPLSVYTDADLDSFINSVPASLSQIEHLLISELPSYYSVGRWYGCVATDKIVECWGAMPNEVVELINKSVQFPLRRLTSAGEKLCVLDAKQKVYCASADNFKPGIQEKFVGYNAEDFYSGGESLAAGYCIKDKFSQIFCELDEYSIENGNTLGSICDGGMGPCYVAILPTVSEVQVSGSRFCALTSLGRECFSFYGNEILEAQSSNFQRSSNLTQNGLCALDKFGEAFCEKITGNSYQEKMVFIEDEGHFLGTEKIQPRYIFKVDGANRFCFYTNHSLYSYVCGIPEEWSSPKSFAFLDMHDIKKVASFGDVDCAVRNNGRISCYNFTGQSEDNDEKLKAIKAVYDGATNAVDILHGCVRYTDRIDCMAKDIFGNLVPNVLYTNGSLFAVAEVRQWLRWQDSLCVLLNSGAVTCFNQTGITHQWHQGTFKNPRQLIVFRYESLSWDENTFDVCLSHDQGVECVYTKKNALNFINSAENIVVGDLNEFGCAKLFGAYKCWGEAYFADAELVFPNESKVFLQPSSYPEDTMMCSYSNTNLGFQCAFNAEVGAKPDDLFSDLLGVPNILREGFGIL